MKKTIFTLLSVLAIVLSTNVFAADNWDKILNDYEKYVDDYIVVMKKVNAGDISAMANATSMMTTASSLSKKLEKADDDLSSSQAARYLKITSKLAGAASSF